MQLKNESISVAILSYKQEGSTFSYIIEIRTRYKQLWQISKRYSQFEELHKKLSELFQNLPALPKKSFITFLVGKSKEDLEERRQGLEDFLKQLVVRREIYNSTILRDFLKLDQCDDFNQPTLIGSHTLTLGVRDMIASDSQALLIVCTADMNVLTRVDAYVNNLKMPWDNNPDSKTIPVGTVECYLKEDDEFKRLWQKEFGSQPICMYWDAWRCVLLIGLDSGNINLLKLNEKSSFKKFDESIEIEMHQSRIMGLFCIGERVHSIGKDRHYKIVDLEQNCLILDTELGECELTALLHSEERCLSIVGDRGGQIFIINLKAAKPERVLTIQTETSFIRGLYLDHDKNYLMTVSYDDGCICVLDVAKGIQEGFAKIKTKIQAKVKSREIAWSRKRGELFVGNEDGTVSVYNAVDLNPIFVLKAHEKGITKLLWYEENSILVTAGKDEKIKWWHFPKQWRLQEVDEEIKSKQLMEAKMESLLKIQQKNQKVDSDDEASLGSWHK